MELLIRAVRELKNALNESAASFFLLAIVLFIVSTCTNTLMLNILVNTIEGINK